MRTGVSVWRISKGAFVILIMMLAVARASLAQLRLAKTTQKFNVAIFVFPGVQVIDFAGPYEVFSESGMNVYTVGETVAPLHTAAGLPTPPKISLKNRTTQDL